MESITGFSIKITPYKAQAFWSITTATSTLVTLIVASTLTATLSIQMIGKKVSKLVRLKRGLLRYSLSDMELSISALERSRSSRKKLNDEFD